MSDLHASLSSTEARACCDELAREVGERTIVRVDRLDPSKNIVAGFRAFDLLLQRHPKWIGRVKFLAFLVPSRTSIPEYRAYADEVFNAIRTVNTRHGRPGWAPITVFHEHNRPRALVALGLYDVLLVNPLADGMNLVSKEGPVINQRDGALVLSTAAGSYGELREGALPVWPENLERTAEAMHAALSLPPGERRERAERLRRAVLAHNLDDWLGLLLDDLAGIERREVAPVGVR
jgi:trehalose 6-phosphate synthase